MERYVTLPDGASVPAIGQGTWFLGEQRSRMEQEKEALTAGVKAGMTLIDTAEMYGSGKAESLIGRTIAGMDRSSLFLVSKVYPHNAGRKNIFKSCLASLERMGTDYLDLYLLHWRGGIPLEETVECMEQLKKEGKIRRWGVSNFDTSDMEELWSVPGGKNCAVNQVLYHAASRGIEYDLLPWMREHHVPLMAYCPLAQGGDLRRGLYENAVLKNIAAAHGASISQVLLAFVVRDGSTIAIPRSSRKEHTLDNAGADGLALTEAELSAIDQEFPAPRNKVYLDIV
ncbi:aldo/keto reductase [Clostridium sp. AN503]|uniref:aldo/keto reductase n=1 Tax=Clostridium sp. AN503 TaxID=3160598 RepID=UPI003458C4BA